MRKRSSCPGISDGVNERRTIGNRIRTISMALSVMLMVLFLALLVFSYFRQVVLDLSWTLSAKQGSRWCYVSLIAVHGKVGIAGQQFVVSHQGWRKPTASLHLEDVRATTLQGDGVVGSMGFGGWYNAYLIDLPHFISSTRAGVWCPTWLPTILFAIWPAVALRRRKTRQHRQRAGLCLFCAYDLRSSPGRCPECGRPIELPATIRRVG